MNKTLITGAAGFIGCHLAQYLLTHTDDTLVLADNFQRGTLDQTFQTLINNPRVIFLSVDLTNEKSAQYLGSGYRHVYHLAAINGTKFFYEIPHEVLRVNIQSLFVILNWMKEKNNNGKLLFTSSNEAYGGALESFNTLPIPTPESVPLVISNPQNPRFSYAGSKLIGELMVTHYAAAYGFRALIVRPHNFYGPRAGYNHVIPEMIDRIGKREEPFTVYGADETRSFCHIHDAVAAMHLLMETSKTDTHPIETIHIGTSVETKISDLAELLFDTAGWRPQALQPHSSPSGSVNRRLPDISKITHLIDWQPRIELSEGLRGTYDWYRIHPKP